MNRRPCSIVPVRSRAVAVERPKAAVAGPSAWAAGGVFAIVFASLLVSLLVLAMLLAAPVAAVAQDDIAAAADTTAAVARGAAAAATVADTAATSVAADEFVPGPDVQLVDRILAIVDEEVILQSDLERELELYRLDRQYAGEPVPADDAELRRELLDRLIEGKLIIAAAKQAEMVVEEEAVEESVERRIQELVDHLGSRDNLVRELNRAGMTLEDYRSRAYTQIRDDMYLRLVVGRFIRPRVEVMDNEVEQYYLANLADMPAEADSLTVSDILVPVKPSPELREAVQTKVREVQAALAGGQDFADLARRYSEGPNAVRGGIVGTVARGDLFDPALERAVFALKPDQVSQPVLSSRGVHIVRLDGIQEDGRRAIRQIFFSMQVSDDDVKRARTRLDEARERLAAGQPFSLVAEEYSEDPSSARNGGLLGTFSLQDLSPQFQEALAGVPEGNLSEPVLTPAGWYLFLVNERRDGHRYTFEELKDELRRRLEAQRMEQRLADYVQELRGRFFVEEKG
ncbi:MAG: peptidylprolyl isomerase [Candidatus Krumholzibacteriia bacterium]